MIWHSPSRCMPMLWIFCWCFLTLATLLSTLDHSSLAHSSLIVSSASRTIITMKLYHPRKYEQPVAGLDSYALREFRILRNGRITGCEYAVSINDGFHTLYPLAHCSHNGVVWNALSSGNLRPVSPKNHDIVKVINSIHKGDPSFIGVWGQFFGDVHLNEHHINLVLRRVLASGVDIRRGDFISSLINELESQFLRRWGGGFFGETETSGITSGDLYEFMMGEKWEDFKRWKKMEFGEAFHDILTDFKHLVYQFRDLGYILF